MLLVVANKARSKFLLPQGTKQRWTCDLHIANTFYSVAAADKEARHRLGKDAKFVIGPYEVSPFSSVTTTTTKQRHVKSPC